MNTPAPEGSEDDSARGDLRGKAVSGAASVVGMRIGRQVIQLFGTILLARLVVPEHFGLVAMATVFTGILVEFGTLRLSDAVIQADEVSDAQLTTLFWITIGLCTVLTLAGLVLGPIISSIYGEPQLSLVVQVLFMGFLLYGFSSLQIALLTRRMRFFAIGANEVVATVVAFGAAVVFAAFGGGYWALVLRHLALPTCIAIGAWTLCRWRPGWPRYHREALPLVVFGIRTLGCYFLGYLTKSVDKFLIGMRFGTTALGYYDRSYQLFVLPVNQICFPLTGVAVSTLRRLRDDPERFLRYYVRAVSLAGFIGMGTSVVITLVAKDLIFLLLGSQWDMAGTILQYIGFGAGFYIVYGTHVWLYLSLGRADKMLRWNVVATIATCTGFVIGLQFGVIGVAIAYAASFGVLIIPSLLFGGKSIGLRLPMIVGALWAPVMSCGLTILLSGWVVSGWDAAAEVFAGWHPLPRLLLTASAGFGIYVVSTCCLLRSLGPVRELWEIVHEVGQRVRKRQ